MSNDDAYAGGLLTRALDPATQPPEIRAYLQAEIDLLRELVPAGTPASGPPAAGMRVVDIGCGTGRHLALLRDRLAYGLGIDYQPAYVAEARARAGGPPLEFLVGDAAAVPADGSFDLAICMTNSWGTMGDQPGVLAEMRRLAPRAGRRLLSVYAEASVPARSEWYRRMGHAVAGAGDTFVETEGGFRSEHFTEARLRALVGPCVVQPLAGIAYAVTF